jgi:hypothetical protein
VPAQTSDLFLLCSDGLTDMLSEEQILGVVERHRDDIDDALRTLVREANRGGGDDNITVVAFEISDAQVRDGQTREQALPPELVAAPADDEDTLDETDAVPAVDTMVISTEKIRAHVEADEAAKRRHRRRRLLAWLAIVLFVVIVAAIVLWRVLR